MSIDLIPLCFFHFITGWDCPGCGLTRAFFSMFRGDFLKAIKFNALAPVVFLIGIIYLAENYYRMKYKKSPVWFTPVGNKYISRFFAILFFGQWIFKSWMHFEKVMVNKHLFVGTFS
jgi:hypothetical protein